MRYAIYFTPAQDDPLSLAAAEWLGRDAFDGSEQPAPSGTGISPDAWRALTAEPRRYAFHATLKAPFALAEGRSEAELLNALETFAAESTAFDISELVVAGLGPFFALVPGTADPVLQDFTASIVERFEPFRAPLSAADIARRNPEKLSEPQRRYLEQYGYPYVMEEFRFHMTLTGPVAEEDSAQIAELLTARFAPHTGKPRTIDAVTLFVEPARGEPFSVMKRLPLAPDQARKVFA